jgi:hypothetical protein
VSGELAEIAVKIEAAFGSQVRQHRMNCKPATMRSPSGGDEVAFRTFRRK